MRLKPKEPVAVSNRVGKKSDFNGANTRLSQSDYITYLANKLKVPQTRVKTALEEYHAIVVKDIQEYRNVYVYKDVLATNTNVSEAKDGLLERTFSSQCYEAARYSNTPILGSEIERIIATYIDVLKRQSVTDTGACVFKTFNLKKRDGKFSISKTPYIDLPNNGNGVKFSVRLLNFRLRQR